MGWDEKWKGVGVCVFFFRQRTAYEMLRSLVGSEMCIRDRARGEDFTPGSLVGFLYTETAGLIISFVMLRSRVFSKVNAYAGIIAFTLLMLFTLWATATSTMGTVALLVAMIGGVASVVWYVLMARRFFQLSRGAEANATGATRVRA